MFQSGCYSGPLITLFCPYSLNFVASINCILTIFFRNNAQFYHLSLVQMLDASIRHAIDIESTRNWEILRDELTLCLTKHANCNSRALVSHTRMYSMSNAEVTTAERIRQSLRVKEME